MVKPRYSAKIQVYLDESNEWRWRMKRSNGKIMADSSEGYKKRSSCLNSLLLVSSFFGNASPMIKSEVYTGINEGEIEIKV